MHIQELKELAMSRINDLIAEYCPDGVEYRELAELVDYQQPSPYIVSSTNYDDSFSLPVLTAGQSFILGYSDDDQGIFYASAERPVIIFDDFTTSFHWVDFDFKVKSSAIKMLRIKPNVDCSFRYVYYAMSRIQYVPKEHSRQWISIYSTFKIPVPPLPVQEEVVRILDSFSSLEAELEAELEARRKQYAYYRNELLTFDRERVQWLKLGDATFINKGTYITKKQVIPGNIPVILGGVEPAYWHSESNHDGEGIVISRSGANAGFASYWNEPIFVSDGFVLDAKEGVNVRFLFHVLKKEQEKLHSMKRGSGVPHINSKMLANDVVVPVPPLEEQHQIVSILDRFDKLTNDLSSGLPAEIEARRKQYEYYRDRLLSFDELAV